MSAPQSESPHWPRPEILALATECRGAAAAAYERVPAYRYSEKLRLGPNRFHRDCPGTACWSNIDSDVIIELVRIFKVVMIIMEPALPPGPGPGGVRLHDSDRSKSIQELLDRFQ